MIRRQMREKGGEREVIGEREGGRERREREAEKSSYKRSTEKPELGLFSYKNLILGTVSNMRKC